MTMASKFHGVMIIIVLIITSSSQAGLMTFINNIFGRRSTPQQLQMEVEDSTSIPNNNSRPIFTAPKLTNCPEGYRMTGMGICRKVFDG